MRGKSIPGHPPDALWSWQRGQAGTTAEAWGWTCWANASLVRQR